MIKSTKFNIYDIDNNGEKFGDALNKNIANLLIDKIKKITVVFEEGNSTEISYLLSFSYDSDFNIVIEDKLFNMALYNAFTRGSKIKRITVGGVVVDLDDNDRPYVFETFYRNLKIARYNGTRGVDDIGYHEWTLVDKDEEL